MHGKQKIYIKSQKRVQSQRYCDSMGPNKGIGRRTVEIERFRKGKIRR